MQHHTTFSAPKFCNDIIQSFTQQLFLTPFCLSENFLVYYQGLFILLTITNFPFILFTITKIFLFTITNAKNALLESSINVNPGNLSFLFSPIVPQQVIKATNKFKTSRSFGLDLISSYFLKLGMPILASPLSQIFNISMSQLIFPDDWKAARVAPVVKSGPTDDPSNYRPISVLPVVARLFEKLVYDQMYSYLNNNKLLYSKQSGFRSMHSVLSCLLKCTNDWYLNLDKGNFTSVTFIDLKNAFDKVNHEILL